LRPVLRMRNVLTCARAFLRDESGEDLAEYGLLASLIAIVAMVAVGDLGVQISDIWGAIVKEIESIL
jgi:Flp pilus assembly pilin Flp